MLLRNRKGQNTAEYAVLIGLVVAAAIGMQTLVKRSIQGKVKDAVDARPHTVSTFSLAGVLRTTNPVNNTTTTNTTINATVPFIGAENLFASGHQYEPEYLRSDFVSASRTPEHEHVGLGGAVLRAESDTKTKRIGYQTQEKPGATANRTINGT
ncbi:MAG: hypothetical protein PHR44_08140 [Candidatus Omnitrophica bacterium]|nr:hypothetical protein [Candidatus Omnitrophota bacterium]